MDYAKYKAIQAGGATDRFNRMKATLCESGRVSTIKNNKVVVFGGHGFVGKNLLNYLSGRFYLSGRYRVFAPSRIECDCFSLDECIEYISTIQPGYVVNLAAFVGGIGLNKAYPFTMGMTNASICLNVLNAIMQQRHGSPKLIQVGTVCMYPCVPTTIPFKEEEIWNGMPEITNSPYGLAKKFVGYLAKCANMEHGLNVVNLIPTNMYGEHDDFSDNASHVIPAMIKKIYLANRDKTELVLWGDGSPTREFLFVDDFCHAILAAIETDDAVANSGEFINIGSGYEVRMNDLVKMIIDEFGYDDMVVQWDKSKPNGQPRRAIDTSRAKELLNFQARTEFKAGLNQTINWFKHNIAPLL